MRLLYHEPIKQRKHRIDRHRGSDGTSRVVAREALKVKEGIKPVPDFHTVRHTALSPEQNLAVDQVFPITAMVKVKPSK